MRFFRLIALMLVATLIACGSLMAASVELGLSGPGAVNDSTIKAGEKVSVDIYFENDSTWSGFTLGFKIFSKDIKSIQHVKDTLGGLNETGDVKGYAGWQDRSVWDLAGVFVVERDWDGALPELIGFGGVCVKQRYKAHEKERKLSFDIIVPEAGVLSVDSSFFPPGGNWLFSPPAHEPEWGGPYNFKVVK